MERKNLILVCVTIVVAVIIICGAMYITSVKDTKLSLKGTNVEKGDNITFILVDDEGNPLANKTINIEIISSKNKTKNCNLTTNSKGKAKLKAKYEGKFKVYAVFDGELFLKSSSITKKVNIKEKYIAPVKSFPYYNPSIGYYRMTGISDVECAVIEAKNGGYYVMGGDSSVVPYDGVSIDSSYNKYRSY